MTAPRSSVIPDLIDALTALGPSVVPGVTVHDGMPTTATGGDHLAIGVDDPGVTSAAAAANSSQEWAGSTFGSGIDETGEVTCVAWSQNGNSDPKAARDAVFAIHSALLGYLRTHVGLGVAGVLDTRVGGVSEFTQSQDERGATAVLRFGVMFQARI